MSRQATEILTNAVSRDAFLSKSIDFWNNVATKDYGNWSAYYHTYLERVYSFLIPPHSRVLEIGCGSGDLLNAVKPATGLGVDMSLEMVARAEKKYPDLLFKHGIAEELDLSGPWDAIILSDLLNGVWDIHELLLHLNRFCNDSTRIIINSYSRLWQPALGMVRAAGLASPLQPQSWLTNEDIENLLLLAGYEKVKNFSEIILPANVPGLAYIANRFLAKIFPFRHLCLSNFIVARKKEEPPTRKEAPKVSVIVAARNEEGNIEDIIHRTPEMGSGTELIFVEGGSSDNTFTKIEEEIIRHPQKNISLYKQPGVGKGDAVRLGFQKASGQILMILDADMTVPPENLPLFYDALRSGKGEFINGVRLVYPMEGEAMRFWNLVGNKFFSLAFSWLLGQPIKDTLCGTKVLTRENYTRLATNRSYFGEFDPFGDFDLIFGAAKLNLKHVDLPIRYRNRMYGDTNINRWRHGLILLRMVIFAAGKIKFF